MTANLLSTLQGLTGPSRFAHYRTNGEWFALKGAVATFLKDCVEPVVIPPPAERMNFFDALLEPK